MKKHYEVVAAIIEENGKVFCAQRKDSGELARKWEFPGGKVELGETLKESLARELLEELKIQVEVLDFVTTVNHEYETFTITLHAFKCKLISGDIVLTEHLDSKWLDKADLDRLDWAAADIPIVKKIKEA